MKMLKKRSLFFLTLLPVVLINLSTSCISTSEPKISNKEFLEISKKELSGSFKPNILLDANQNISDFTIEDLIKENKIVWAKFEKTVIYNNQKLTVIGQLIQIEYTIESSSAKFVYRWSVKNQNISAVQKNSLLMGLKPIPFRNEPFCHNGHCHPKPDGASVFVVRENNI